MRLDFSRPPKCVEAEKFASWCQALGGELPADLTHEDLDQAMLQLLKEFLYRKHQVNHRHRGFACLREVFEEFAADLFERQMSLFRQNRLYAQVPPDSSKPEEKEKPKIDLFLGETTDD